MSPTFDDLIFAYRALEESERRLHQQKRDLDYRMCRIRYGFGTGDTIKLSEEFVKRETQEADDSFYRVAVQGITTGKVQFVSWKRDYISLNLGGYIREFYTTKEMKEIMEMQK